MLSREILPQLGYKKPACVFNPLLPGLTGDKMSASDEKSKIDVLDGQKQIIKKINKSYCPIGEVNDNGIISIVEYVIFPYLERKGINSLLIDPKNLEVKSYMKTVKTQKRFQ